MADFDITVKHPSYLVYVADWEVMRDTVRGEDAVKARGQAYLPMKSGTRAINDLLKRDTVYNSYKARAEFPEIVSPTVQGSVGLIHAKPTDIQMPAGMDFLRERSTLDGLTLEGLHQRITTEVMRVGRFGLFPGIDDAGQFHLAGYTAEAIRNWDVINGELTFLVLDETGKTRDPETNKWHDDVRLREAFLDDAGQFWSREWIKVKGRDGKEAWVPLEPVPSSIRGGAGLDFIPFVAIGSTDLTMAPDDVPLAGLAKLALRAYRLDADYVNSLHMTSEPTPYVTGVSKEDAPTTIGAAQLWVLPAQGSTAGMLEFAGSGIGAQQQAINDTLERAVIFGAQLFSDNRRTAESGEAIKLRLGSQQASLKSVAMTVAAGLERVLRYIAIWGGMDQDQVAVTPNLDFVDRSLTPQEIVGLVGGWQAGAYSKRTLFDNLQRGEIIGADKTFEDEEQDIDNEAL